MYIVCIKKEIKLKKCCTLNHEIHKLIFPYFVLPFSLKTARGPNCVYFALFMFCLVGGVEEGLRRRLASLRYVAPSDYPFPGFGSGRTRYSFSPCLLVYMGALW